MEEQPEMSRAVAVDPLVESVRDWASKDVMLGVLRRVRTVGRLGAEPLLRPGGIDAVACMLARSVLGGGGSNEVAFALPRGSSPLPVLLGLYIALWNNARAAKAREFGHFHSAASVSVATGRTDLRDLARSLSFDGSAMEELVIPARLVTTKDVMHGGEVRRRAAAAPLTGGTKVPLSHADCYLLFHRPLTMPPLADGLVSAMVVDAAGIKRSGWETTRERNLAARRTQVWVAELGDQDFERFCEEQGIPLVRFDWALLQAAVGIMERGSSGLCDIGLHDRALARAPISWRAVVDEELAHEFENIYEALRQMRRRGRSDLPEGIRLAYRLAGLVSRLACPLAHYERAAGPNPFTPNAEQQLSQVDRVDRSSFVGRRWKEAFDDYWPGVRAALANLVRLAGRTSDGKVDALAELTMETLEMGFNVRVMCQTRTAAAATREWLREFDLDSDERVTVNYFGQRIEHGAADSLVTVMTAPPPPWQRALLLTGERGRQEVLCHPHEAGRLRGMVRSANADFEGIEHNQGAATLLGLPPSGVATGGYAPALDDLLVAGVSLGHGNVTADPEEDITAPGDGLSYWEELVGLYGADLPIAAEDSAAEGGGETYSGYARLVTFTDAQPVLFADDRPVTVHDPSAGEDDAVRQVMPGQLAPGMRVVFLPGAERSDLLGALMETWDEQLETERRMFEPLFMAALQAAVANAGGEAELAHACDHHIATVRNWLTGHNWPQKPEKFQVILDLAEMPEASRAAASIWRYFERVRGAHRLIGRRLNETVAETVLAGDAPAQLRALSCVVGDDVQPLFDQVEAVTVATVSEPQPVAFAACSQFLDDSDIKKAGIST